MHYYEKNIVEIKNEYTSYLTNRITPLIYEGIKRLYNEAINTEKRFVESSKIDPRIKNPGVFKIFQIFLKDIQNLNNSSIEAETNRIINGSKCSDVFENLVKAVIKSHIVLLTYNASEKKCKVVNEKLHETIDVKTFIHKCYIECSRVFYNNPELFWHGFTTLDIKRNQREAYDLIKIGISEAIKSMLPMKLILEEYLNKDYIDEHPVEKFTDMKTMAQRDLQKVDVNGMSALDESASEASMSTEEAKKKLDNNSVFKIMDSEESDIEEKIDDIEDSIKSDKIDNLVLGNDNTNLNLSALEKKSESELREILNQPGVVQEPLKLKKPKNPMEDIARTAAPFLNIPKESNESKQIPLPIPEKTEPNIDVKIQNKISKNTEEKEKFYEELLHGEK